MESSPFDQTYLQSAQNAAAARTYRLASRHGLSEAEREDIRQELILDLLERATKYDPSKASANTFTGMVSEHRAVEVLDGLMKERARRGFFPGGEAANDPEMRDVPDDYGDNVVPMWAEDRDLFSDSMALRDLETALVYMNDEQVALFELLKAHQDLPDACKASAVSRATFYRRVGELQMHLRMFGFRSAA